MGELNEQQKRLCDMQNGFVIVDAGPGTGKTHTIVERYIKTLCNNVAPTDILMLTFTKNVAMEMREKISSMMIRHSADDHEGSGYLMRYINNIRTGTFDSLCLDIVLNSPDVVNRFFSTDSMLSRNAKLIDNETLNEQYFLNFYSKFVRVHRERYIKKRQDPAALIGDNPIDLYKVLSKLMARGVIPKKLEWFGNGEKIITGDLDYIRKNMVNNQKEIKKKLSDLVRDSNSDFFFTSKNNEKLENLIEEALIDDRFILFEYIHDVYYYFICECIKDNRLTFSLCELFAYIILLNNNDSRKMHSIRYLTVDEFQDTNELQMKICLLLLKEPNLCVVGDWKQGIYGFRFVSIDNITHFAERLEKFIDELEATGVDIPFKITKPEFIPFINNYRSSAEILKYSFESLNIAGNDSEIVKNDVITELDAVKNKDYEHYTEVVCISNETNDDEIKSVVDRITEYVCNEKYKIVNDDGSLRNVEFGDIAVLSRNTKNCIKLRQICQDRKVPAFFQGDVEVMLTREGKLALAWLRYVNNESDPRGLSTILVDMGYSLAVCEEIVKPKKDYTYAAMNVPIEISNLRKELYKKRRRPNDLLTTMFSIYGLSNEMTQAIISIISSAYASSLMTISDLIRLIEDDMVKETRYSVDPLLDRKAVTIQTIHKSKGLEYPVVIAVGFNTNSFPSTQSDTNGLFFADKIGIRCTKSFINNDFNGEEHQVITNSWKTALICAGFPTDYSEERRLLFVAMSRAKQYLTLTSGKKPSNFFKHYANELKTIKPKGYDIDDSQSLILAEKPVISNYKKRRVSLSVHDLMSSLADPIRSDMLSGKGAKYGDDVHEAAYLYIKKGVYDDKYPEMSNLKTIVDGFSGAKLQSEVKCVLPIGNVSIHGIIDLLVEYDEYIEIHDWKTDTNEDYLDHYRLQVSVYAHATEKFYGKAVKCYIDFLTLNKQILVQIEPIESLNKAIDNYYRSLSQPF